MSPQFTEIQYIVVVKQQNPLQMQYTTFLEEVKTVITNSSSLGSIIFNDVLKKSLSGLRHDVRAVYDRGDIVSFLILLKLMGISSINKIWGCRLDTLIPFQKDVLYSVRNNPFINWRRLLIRNVKNSLVDLELEPVDNNDMTVVPCLIADDSDIPKRGKCMELIGRIFSHVSGSYPLGYKSLNLAFWTGKNLYHLDFSWHIEKGKKNNQGLKKSQLKARYSKHRPKGSHGSARVKEASESKISTLCTMISRAVKAGIPAQYVLADSWFFNNRLIQHVTSLGLHMLSRPKMNNWKYACNNKEYTLGQLVRKYCTKRNRTRSRKLGLYTVSISVEYKGTRCRLYFFKSFKRGSKWQPMICTNGKLTAIQAYKLYQNRWAIEVSYKELKQHCGYGKSQAQNFCSQIADSTITLIAYNLMSRHKSTSDYLSIGGLFNEVSKDWVKPNIMQRLWMQFIACLKPIAQLFDTTVDDLLEKIFQQNQFLKKVHLLFDKLTTET